MYLFTRREVFIVISPVYLCFWKNTTLSWKDEENSFLSNLLQHFKNHDKKLFY